MTTYLNETHDEERAFYGISNAVLKGCAFKGAAYGESALKETSNLVIEDCDFLLRYPLWHTAGAVVDNIRMTDTCRAALWYDRDITITNSILGGIKALRECDNMTLKNCKINSTEFGWFCRGVKMTDCELISEYPFLRCSDMEFDGLHMTGKYSFQYVQNAVIRNSELNTKDAFWHSKNVTVYDSVVKGEYLGWYSENLHLVRCKIIGTQPLCYAKGLVLEDCEMIDCDLSFEKSDVTAVVLGEIMSVKNPLSGKITADRIGDVIIDDPDCQCVINVSACCTS
ncbi:MAG: DUF3737 family protein [Clostridia bacterium]|nr:DUF3737 family protein [Clostridia bacterium]